MQESRKKIIEHLQKALDLCEGPEAVALSYRIARALDEARAMDRDKEVKERTRT
jgi:hypothetical protein